MFLPTMNHADFMAQLEHERAFIIHHLDNLYKRELRNVRKSLYAGRIYQKTDHFTNKQSLNEYLAVVTVLKKKDIPHPLYKVFKIMRQDNGELCLLTSFVETTVVFTPHFFDRYNERMSLGMTDRMELLSTFARRNWNESVDVQPKERNGYCEFELRLTDGAAMMLYNPNFNVYVAKTFITSDMFYKKQQERMDKSQILTREELYLSTIKNNLKK